MLIDARGLAANPLPECDVCVIGAGPAGISLALELEGSGLRIALIESGGLSYDRDAQALLAGEVGGGPHQRLSETRLAALGGSSEVWAGWCRPLDPIDLEKRAGMPHSGWPFTYAELAPHYRRAHELCGLGPPDYDVRDWETRTRLARIPLLEDELAPILYHVSPLRFGSKYREHLEHSPSVTTLLHATALRVNPEMGSDRVRDVELATRTGRRFRIQARCFVIAAGAIESARLLLLSGNSPERILGNAHGNVGRYFMDHGAINSGIYVAARPHSARDLAFYFPCSASGGGNTSVVRAAFGVRSDVLEREQMSNCALFFRAQYEAHAAFDTSGVRAMLETWDKLRGRAVPGHYAAVLRRAARNPAALLTAAWCKLADGEPNPARWPVRAVFECAPDRANRVTLASTRDAFGRPHARLEWRANERDIASVIAAQSMFDRALRRSGAGYFTPRFPYQDAAAWREAIEAGKHHLGTLRMHDDPAHGVTDRDGKVHGVANLYAAGGALFTTGGFANPTLTIVALAVRLAGHLRARVLVRPVR